MTSQPSFSSKYGPWALVTGAAMGLGAEFSSQLAQRGLNIVMADIDTDALQQTANAVTAQTMVQVRTAVCDLSTQEGLASLIQCTQDLQIGMLVNNVGISAIGHFLDIPLEKHLQILDVNLRSQLVLTHHFGAKMRDQGCGGIIFVSSASGVVGTSYVGVYSATKAFGLNLGEALWEELRTSGVDVLVTMVGAADTPGWRAENPHPEAKTWPPVMSARDTVCETLDAIGKTSSIYPGVQNRLAMLTTTRLLPRGTAVRVIGGEMRKRYGR